MKNVICIYTVLGTCFIASALLYATEYNCDHHDMDGNPLESICLHKHESNKNHLKWYKNGAYYFASPAGAECMKTCSEGD